MTPLFHGLRPIDAKLIFLRCSSVNGLRFLPLKGFLPVFFENPVGIDLHYISLLAFKSYFLLLLLEVSLGLQRYEFARSPAEDTILFVLTHQRNVTFRKTLEIFV